MAENTPMTDAQKELLALADRLAAIPKHQLYFMSDGYRDVVKLNRETVDYLLVEHRDFIVRSLRTAATAQGYAVKAMEEIAAVSACVAVVENPESHIKMLASINAVATKALKERSALAEQPATPSYAAGFEAGLRAAADLARRWRDDASNLIVEDPQNPTHQVMRNICQNISTAISALPAPAKAATPSYAAGFEACREAAKEVVDRIAANHESRAKGEDKRSREYANRKASACTARTISAALSALPAPAKAASEETGWLIEKDDPPVYAVLTDDADEHWLPDASNALRFARREDAQAFVDYIGWTSPPVRVVDHMWPALAHITHKTEEK